MMLIYKGWRRRQGLLKGGFGLTRIDTALGVEEELSELTDKFNLK
jgi:hypothetical protein